MTGGTGQLAMSPWHDDAHLPLLPEESVLAKLETDLDSRLHFQPGMLIVTNRRLLSRQADESAWSSRYAHLKIPN